VCVCVCVSGRASGVKMVVMVEVGSPINLDGVAVHPDCWCICLCYLHFASENPEDGIMYLLLLAHLGFPGHSPESHKMVVVVVVLCWFSPRLVHSGLTVDLMMSACRIMLCLECN